MNYSNHSSDRRRHRRVPVSLNGRLMLTTRQELPCKVVDMSPGGLRLVAAVDVRPGERIVAYVDEIGRVEGLVARSTRRDFAIALNATSRKREKLTAMLTYHANRHELSIEDMRGAARSMPRLATVTIALNDGRAYVARLNDVSATGLSVTCDAPLIAGMTVSADGRLCKVVRTAGCEHGLSFV